MISYGCREGLGKDLFSSSLLVLLSLILIGLPVSYSEAFQARLLPAKIQPGDAFIIRISGLKGAKEPSAALEGKPLSFSSCGRGCFVAVGAIDIESKPGVYRVPLKLGKRQTMLRLHVSKGRFKTIDLTLPEDKVSPGSEDLQRINEEACLLNSIWQIDSERLWEGSFVFPLRNPLSTPFGTKRIINQGTVSLHRGLDIEGTAGEEIHAANKGRVVLTEELFFGGNTIIIDHGQGIFTVYMHLSAFNVNPGDLVAKNAVIGFVGSTGRASGPHLHFGVKIAGINVNPVSLIGLKL